MNKKQLYLANAGLLNESVSYQDICSIDNNEKKHKGFCVNPRCEYLSKQSFNLYHVNNNILGWPITENQTINFCRKCNHALFWSKRYRQTNMRVVS